MVLLLCLAGGRSFPSHECCQQDRGERRLQRAACFEPLKQGKACIRTLERASASRLSYEDSQVSAIAHDSGGGDYRLWLYQSSAPSWGLSWGLRWSRYGYVRVTLTVASLLELATGPSPGASALASSMAPAQVNALVCPYPPSSEVDRLSLVLCGQSRRVASHAWTRSS